MANTNAENQAAYRTKKQADGFVACTIWIDKKLLRKVKKLAILNELKNDDQFNRLLEKGLKQELKEGLIK